ncbi:lipoprotein [Streptomyces sp. NPDC006610]|uniref:lipoprotein n=1 Tax=Streptomyces sp. NPDC006610 TaxID=3154584 RepID=UPI0033B4D373
MLVGAGKTGRGLAGAALAAGLLTGCAEGAGEGAGAAASASPSASASASASDSAAGNGPDGAAESGGAIGVAGSACELPVTFDIAAKWEASPVDTSAWEEADPEVVDAVLRQGPVTAACEVNAKPAGHIGFLRVWTGKPGDDDARAVLEAFVEAGKGASREKYRALDADGLVGAEVSYLYGHEFSDEPKKEKALAVTTPDGPVVLHLGGMDDEEHEAMLPAFELAKRTLRAL